MPAPPVVLEVVLQTADDAVLLLQLPHHVLDDSAQHNTSSNWTVGMRRRRVLCVHSRFD